MKNNELRMMKLLKLSGIALVIVVIATVLVISNRKAGKKLNSYEVSVRDMASFVKANETLSAVAYVKQLGNQQTVVVNGRSSRKYDRISYESITLSTSPDLYCFSANKGGKKLLVIYNHGMTTEYVAEAFTVALNSGAVKYIACVQNHSEQYVVEDGHVHGPYSHGRMLCVLTPDNDCIYAVRESSAYSIIVNGKVQCNGILDMHSLQWDAHRKSCVYARKLHDGKWYVYRKDTCISKAFDQIKEGSIVEKNNVLAYWAKAGRYWYVFVNGQQIDSRSETPGELLVSDKGGRVTYTVIQNGKTEVVCNHYAMYHGDKLVKLLAVNGAGTKVSYVVFEAPNLYRLMLNTKSIASSQGIVGFTFIPAGDGYAFVAIDKGMFSLSSDKRQYLERPLIIADSLHASNGKLLFASISPSREADMCIISVESLPF